LSSKYSYKKETGINYNRNN